MLLISGATLPLQRAYVERVIGTIRRECLDHVIVFIEASQPVPVPLGSAATIMELARTLQNEPPEACHVQPPEVGRIISLTEMAGLHHRYERRAA